MAITYGMSVKEFWEDNPDLFWAYRFSYFERLNKEQEITNHNAWLQGAYFHEAMSVAIFNTFSKQKREYSKAPYGIKKDVEEKHENQNQIQILKEALVKQIQDRVAQVRALKESSTTEKGNTEGGEINE